MSNKKNENAGSDWDFVKDVDEGKEESKLKQFLMIAIPVGAFVLIGVIVLIFAIGAITKVNKKKDNYVDLNNEGSNSVVSGEEGDGGDITSVRL